MRHFTSAECKQIFLPLKFDDCIFRLALTLKVWSENLAQRLNECCSKQECWSKFGGITMPSSPSVNYRIQTIIIPIFGWFPQYYNIKGITSIVKHVIIKNYFCPAYHRLKGVSQKTGEWGNFQKTVIFILWSS